MKNNSPAESWKTPVWICDILLRTDWIPRCAMLVTGGKRQKWCDWWMPVLTITISPNITAAIGFIIRGTQSSRRPAHPAHPALQPEQNTSEIKSGWKKTLEALSPGRYSWLKANSWIALLELLLQHLLHDWLRMDGVWQFNVVEREININFGLQQRSANLRYALIAVKTVYFEHEGGNMILTCLLTFHNFTFEMLDDLIEIGGYTRLYKISCHKQLQNKHFN